MSKASKIISRSKAAVVPEISPELLAQAIALLQGGVATSVEAPAKRTKSAKPEPTHLSIPIGKQVLFLNLKAGNGWIEGDVEKVIAALQKAFPKSECVHRERKK